MKSYADALIFHTAVCFFVKTNSSDGRRETACANCVSSLRDKSLKRRIHMNKKRKEIIAGNKVSEIYEWNLGGYNQKVLIDGKDEKQQLCD
mgnify:CR=1 FL=1